MFGRTKIIDPFNTMGDPGATALTVPAPYRDEYTPDRVVVSDHPMKSMPLEYVAAGYGLTLSAARRFRESFDTAAAHKGTARGDRAAQECRDILASKQNRKRW